VCGWGLHFKFRTRPLKSQERPCFDGRTRRTSRRTEKPAARRGQRTARAELGPGACDWSKRPPGAEPGSGRSSAGHQSRQLGATRRAGRRARAGQEEAPTGCHGLRGREKDAAPRRSELRPGHAPGSSAERHRGEPRGKERQGRAEDLAGTRRWELPWTSSRPASRRSVRENTAGLEDERASWTGRRNGWVHGEEEEEGGAANYASEQRTVRVHSDERAEEHRARDCRCGKIEDKADARKNLCTACRSWKRG
jgi:hypothetical protein